MTDLNKLRQVKEYKQWKPEDGDVDPGQYDGDLAQQVEDEDWAKPREFSEIYEEIAWKVMNDLEEQLFELINEYCDDYDELYWNRFLTDDAPVELLDASFENYHEHYDNIFKLIMRRLDK